MQACIPSSCGMFVYRDDTSMLTKIASSGTLRVVISSINSLESLMYEGSLVTRGFNHPSKKFDIFSVTAFTLDTIGLIPIGFLCIFFRKYSCDVLKLWGGVQKSTNDLGVHPCHLSVWRNLVTSWYISPVISLFNLRYTVGSSRCFKPSSM